MQHRIKARQRAMRFAAVLGLALFSILSVRVLSTPALAKTSLNHMRAVHMAGNWNGNLQGIKTAVSGIIDDAPALTAGSVQTSVGRSSFPNAATGATVTSDFATVTLNNATVGTTQYAKVGFTLARDVSTGDISLQFSPSFDANLAAIPGFTGDMGLRLSAAGLLDTTNLGSVTGAARQYVTAVAAAGATLVQSGTFKVSATAALDQAATVKALQDMRAKLLLARDEYWQFLRAENVDWIGISVAIFYDSIADPTVRVEYSPVTVDNTRFYTYNDADLQNFITRAKQQGFKVYLTLAFESVQTTTTTDPKCNTSKAVPSRFEIGRPSLSSGYPCVLASDWWWSPSHSNHVANVATFWNTYTQVAVKYAKMAEQLGVDMYSLGTETDNLFRTRTGATPFVNNFKSQLTQMVGAVRAVYSGLVTYDITFFTLTGSFQGQPNTQNDLNTNYWALFSDIGLDVIGISAQFDLTTSLPTTVIPVSQLETAWEAIFQNTLIPVQAANGGLPIVFTEFDYSDDIGSPFFAHPRADLKEPTVAAGSITPGQQQQLNIYQAFFNVDDRHNNTVKGIFPWDNGVFTGWPNYCTNYGWGLYCKPLAETVKSIYARWAALEAAASPAVRPSPIFSSAQTGSQSFLRFFNTGASAAKASVTLTDYATGQFLGQWNSPTAIPAGAELQYAIGTVEQAAGISGTKPNYYAVSVQAGFGGYFQHVLFRPADGTLTNSSTCATGVTADPSKLSGVHTSLLSSGYPSSVVISNTGTAAQAVTLGIYDARDGTKLGTYTSASVPANGELIPSVADIEAGAHIAPSSSMYHYVIKVEGAFTGYLQHLVNNTQKGVITDMTTACGLNGATSGVAAAPLLDGAIFSTAQPGSQSFLRFYNTGATAATATVTLRNYATGQTVGNWTTPAAIPAGAEQQFAISSVESGAGVTGTKPNYYSISVSSAFNGYFQHVLFRPSDGTLTNLSTCASGVTADATKLAGVHTSVLDFGFPSSIAINNTGSSATTVTVGIYDARDGTKLGTYTSASIPAGGQVIPTVAEIEAGAHVTPTGSMYHYVLKVESSFTGFLQNLVNNLAAGVITDMTTACALKATGP